MNDTSKAPAKTGSTVAASRGWQPFESLKQEVDRLFDEFDGGFWPSPFRRAFQSEPLRRLQEATPAVDIAEKDGAYEISAELPGMEEKDIDVSVANGVLTIKGEKREEKEEKRKDYHVSERRYGTFQRSFSVPDGIDADKISASFKKGVLTIALPKTPEAQKLEKKISIKTA